MPMDIHVGDVLTMKKAHPCGEKRWQVLRVGADFKLRCLGCGHEVMGPRSKFEKKHPLRLFRGELTHLPIRFLRLPGSEQWRKPRLLRNPVVRS